MIGTLKRVVKGLLAMAGYDLERKGTVASLSRDVVSLRAEVDSLKNYLEAYKHEMSLVPLSPDHYRYVKNAQGEDVLTFSIKSKTDFDWLEDAIQKHGYYEKPNIWSFTVDADKRTLAEMIQSLDPKSLLDIGCANGPLLQALDDLGIAGEGVEISSFALEHAFPAVRERIHHGDLLSLPLHAPYDVISGLDIFEHLNPNRLDAYLGKIHDLLKPGGHVFANIPAFGKDDIFGEVFEYYLADWENDRRDNSCFTTIHVDMHGYPVNGHLIWADTAWWIDLFEKHGFRRDAARETSLHRSYDDKLFYARRSFYIFQKPG
jgi:SAM-dependent methyltransferase